MIPLLSLASAAQFDVASIERARVLKTANEYLKQEPVTITASRSPRSAGGLHDDRANFSCVGFRITRWTWNEEGFALWKSLPADSNVEEVVLWVD